LDGGRLCLDFVNTIHDRYAVDAEDYIGQPERFIEWCDAGALRLASTSPRLEPRPRAALMRRRTLRHHVDALLTSRIDGVPPPATPCRVSIGGYTVPGPVNRERDGQMHWRDDASNALLPLKRIALDALALISDPVSQLRRCASTGHAAGCSSIPARTSAAAGARWKPAARRSR
jgi:hypothetical protein